jgi:mono/diheme cytochrome c family protein
VPSEKRPARWPIFLALILLVGVALIFVVVFIIVSQRGVQNDVPGALTADTYMDIVTPLLVDADAQNGEALLTQYGCAACHVVGAENNVAPSFDGLAARAAERRPPLTAEAYLYESIVHPTAYLVEGYPASMAQDYRERLTDDELGDIIAYLLTR